MDHRIFKNTSDLLRGVIVNFTTALLAELDREVDAACEVAFGGTPTGAFDKNIDRAVLAAGTHAERVARALKLVADGWSHNKASAACEVDRSRVSKECRKLGMKSERGRKPTESNEQKMERAVKLVEDGMSQNKAAAATGLFQSAISVECRKRGIKSRFPKPVKGGTMEAAPVEAAPVKAAPVKAETMKDATVNDDVHAANLARAVSMVRNKMSRNAAAQACGLSRGAVSRAMAREGIVSNFERSSGAPRAE